MKVNWVLAENIERDLVDVSIIKSIAPSYGSYRTWKAYKTDNCVCNDLQESKNLIQRAFHAVCNFYVPEGSYADLGRPVGLKLFGGVFESNAFKYKDDIVSLWLASTDADIVLLLGFDFRPSAEFEEAVPRKGYYNSIAKVMLEHPETQYVLVDYDRELSRQFEDISNFTQDTTEAVKELLI